MTSVPTSRIVTYTVFLVGIMILGAVLWQSGPGDMVTGWTGRILGPAVVQVHRTLAFTGSFIGRSELVTENLRLRQALDRATADTAVIAELQRENQFLQAAMGIRERVGREPIAGAVFSYVREGGVRQVVVNRGSRDLVSRGDIVMTAHGVLVGIVQEVFDRYAVARSFGDPGFEVTARIVDTEVTGLVHPDPVQGLMLDLVQKSETVSEGQQVVTSGNDQFPAGLVIGTVKSVDAQSTTLFKVVRIAPSIDTDFDGSVLIIHL